MYCAKKEVIACSVPGMYLNEQNFFSSLLCGPDVITVEANVVNIKCCHIPSVCWDLYVEGCFVSNYPDHLKLLSSEIRNRLAD